MPSSSFTFSREGPTFCTALRIFAGSVSSVRAQKSSASGLSSICVGSGGLYFLPCWAMPPIRKKKARIARASICNAGRSLLAADPPDRPRAGDLHERRVGRIDERRIGIRAARVAHRAVVDQVGRAVGPEADGRWAVDAV